MLERQLLLLSALITATLLLLFSSHLQPSTMKFTQLAALASVFAAAYAQSISIISPIEEETVAAGSSTVVRVQQEVDILSLSMPVSKSDFP